MSKYTNKRDEWLRYYSKMAWAGQYIIEKMNEGVKTEQIRFKVEGRWHGVYADQTREDTFAFIQENAHTAATLQGAKTILFSSEQAQVFLNHSAYQEKLEYRLPFPSVLLQFDSVVQLPYQLRNSRDYDRGSVMAILLTQTEFTREEFEAEVKRAEKNKVELGVTQENSRPVPTGDSEHIIINSVSFIYKDMDTEFINWSTTENFEHLPYNETHAGKAMNAWRKLAIACIGYINCENVYLEKEGEVDEKVNRKRVREGKRVLEPYYVCRIKGVQYNDKGEEVERDPSGRHVSFRFDVRGHFRRYESGKTTWVRPHQRGLQNELYIPKTYLVTEPKEPLP